MCHIFYQCSIIALNYIFLKHLSCLMPTYDDLNYEGLKDINTHVLKCFILAAVLVLTGNLLFLYTLMLWLGM